MTMMENINACWQYANEHQCLPVAFSKLAINVTPKSAANKLQVPTNIIRIDRNM